MDIIKKIQKKDGSIDAKELILELSAISKGMDNLLERFSIISFVLGEHKDSKNCHKKNTGKKMNAIDIINLCEVFDQEVRFPKIQFDKKTYSEVKLLLENAGGKWVGNKTQAFVFPFNPNRVINELKSGNKINLQQDYQFFETPDEIADWLILLAGGIKVSDTVLEPSAGRGSLIRAIHRSCPESIIDCFELMPENKEFLLKYKNIRLLGYDFTKECKKTYSKIIANPPFSKNQDIDHVKIMYDCLLTGGTLAAITSQHWQIGQEKKCIDFRNWLNLIGAQIYNIESGQFKKSGTTIPTTAIIITKHEAI